jgi:hypothetical protein
MLAGSAAARAMIPQRSIVTNVARRRPELAVGDDATDQADVARPLGVDDLAGEEQLGGALAQGRARELMPSLGKIR